MFVFQKYITIYFFKINKNLFHNENLKAKRCLRFKKMCKLFY